MVNFKLTPIFDLRFESSYSETFDVIIETLTPEGYNKVKRHITRETAGPNSSLFFACFVMFLYDRCKTKEEESIYSRDREYVLIEPDGCVDMSVL